MKTLYNYRYKPRMLKKWLKRGTPEAQAQAALFGQTIRDTVESSRRSIFYGVEIELPGPTRAVLLQAVGEADTDNTRWYCKHDGSIPYTGVEVVSHPATERYHRHHFGWASFWDTVSAIPEFAAQSDENWGACGMHVHVSRSGLSFAAQLALRDAVALFHEFLPRLVGRDFNRWCATQTPYGCGDALQHYWLSHLLRESDRYVALNSSNRATLEFRLCASPRNSVEFWERMELFWALVSFSVMAAESVPEVPLDDFILPSSFRLTQGNFLNWVSRQQSRFPHLLHRCKEAGLLETLSVRDDGQIWLPFVDELQLSEEEIRRVPATLARRRRRV